VSGLEGTAEDVVTPEMTAEWLGSGDVPVLATPMVLALAERAAVAAVADVLPEASTTVGAAVEMAHEAPTPVGAWIRARARLEDVVGRRLRFSFTVEDEAGRIASGTHVRVVVTREQFEAAASTRRTIEPP
jgi:fluoroacetyl-CoA thioesterase